MSQAVSAAYNIPRSSATKLVSRSRAAGHPVPFDLPTKLEAGDAPAVRIASSVAVGTITLEEYRRRTANATRPLTDSGIITRHQGPIRSLLAGHRA